MSERRYTQMVKRELVRLADLASERESESRLREISAMVNRWKKGSTGSFDALGEIQRLSGTSPVTWSHGADPGVPVAHAVAAGYLKRKDFSDASWKAVEVLVTLAEI
jgi:hypothetical protein